jgi:predicted Zn-dependent peptidase
MNLYRLASFRNVPVASAIAAFALALGACSGPGPETPAGKTETTSAITTPPQGKDTGAQKAESDGDFRKKAPAPGPEVVFVPPKIEEARLSNGIRVLLVERHELPIVAFQIVVDRGAAQGTPGLGAFTAAMLLQGTKTRSAIAISDDLGKLGAAYDAWADYDSVGVSARCLAPKLPDVLTILGDVVQNPRFDGAELKRERARRLTAILQQNDRPATILSNTVAGALYPAGHPYSVPLIGTEQDVNKIGVKDLAGFHAAHFMPDRVTIAIAGDVTKDSATRELERVFGAWKGKAKQGTEAAEPPPPAATAARVFLIDRPGATQSHVAAALPGVPRSTKDFEAILVMNTILGGQFSSRLNLNLREKHAYTYGARSGFDMRLGPGPFVAGGAIVRESTGPALTEVLSEIKRIRADLVTDEEIADAKSTLVLQLPARFETASETAASLGVLAVYNLPIDEYANRAAKIQAVTREDVKRVADRYLAPDRLRLVVVGDAKVVEEQLAKLGFGAMDVKRAAAPPAGAAAGAKAPAPGDGAGKKK